MASQLDMVKNDIARTYAEFASCKPDDAEHFRHKIMMRVATTQHLLNGEEQNIIALESKLAAKKELRSALQVSLDQKNEIVEKLKKVEEKFATE